MACCCKSKTYLNMGYMNYIPGNPYNIGQTAIYDNLLYYSKINNNTTIPSQSSNTWGVTTPAALIAASGAALNVPAWVSTVHYDQNDIVIYNGNWCVSNIPGEGTNTNHIPGADDSWGIYASFPEILTWILNHGEFHQ